MDKEEKIRMLADICLELIAFTSKEYNELSFIDVNNVSARRYIRDKYADIMTDIWAKFYDFCEDFL